MNRIHSDAEQDLALNRATKLAIALFIYGLFTIFGGCLMTVGFAGPGYIKDAFWDRYARITALLSPFVGVFVIYGAYCLRKLRRQVVVDLAICMTLLPLFGTCFPFGVPIFIWGAVVSGTIFAASEKKSKESQ